MKGVILIDSPHPVGHEPLPDAIIAHVVKSASMNGAGNAARQNIITQFQTNAALLGNYKAPQKGIPNAKVVMLRSQDVFDCGTICGVRYPWLSDQKVRWDAIAAWEKLVGHNIQVLDIPGNHFQAFATQNVSPTYHSDLVGLVLSG